jgi:acylphosphatase
MADTNSDPPPPAEPPASPRQRAELRISGQVQGVYYRSAASEQARVLGLRGTVRNLPGGEVELIAEGPATALQELIAWCHLGPPAARVDKVSVDFAEPRDEFPDFRVVRSLP